eukprot:TRINITY_DN4811_c0_g1_i1.p1 TRINITY_DN4811_c0_g1~~TRINITY_DN4811_c0_g1_i1.p1  ORF type:complete len:918 (+),score=248.61 TRINITY_DN4811_c0_g1_i1:88-2754(+)
MPASKAQLSDVVQGLCAGKAIPRSRPVRCLPSGRPASAPPRAAVPLRGVRLAVPLGSSTKRGVSPAPVSPKATVRPQPLAATSKVAEADSLPSTEDAQKEMSELRESDLQPHRSAVSTWPAVGPSGHTERSPAPSLLQRLQSHMEATARRLAQFHSPSKPPVEEAFKGVLETFAIFVGESTTYRSVLKRVLDDATAFVSHFEQLRADFKQQEDRIMTVDREYLDIVSDMKGGFAHNVQLYKAKIQEHQAEMQKLLMLVDMVNDHNRGMKSEISAAHQKAEEAENQRQVTAERMRYKRSALRELQERTQMLVQENTTLYQVAQYNEDLLHEIEEKREELQRKAAEHRLASERQAREVERQRGRAEQSNDYIRSLQMMLRQQLAEIGQLRSALQQQSAELSECRQQRDELMTQNTPRPDFTALDKSLPAVGLLRMKSTHHRVAALADTVPELRRQRDDMDRRLQAAEAVHAFLSADVSLTAIGQHPLPPGGRLFAGQGVTDLVRPYLRHLGPVRCRGTSMAETRQMMQEFDAYVDRTGHLNSKGRPDPDGLHLDEVFSAFLGTKTRSEEVAVEHAYNFFDGLERYSQEPEIHAFQRALVHQDCSIAVHREVLNTVAAARTALESIDLKLSRQVGGRPGILKRRVVHDVLTQLSKGRSDAELLRLKGALDRDLKKRQQELKLGRDDVPWELIFQQNADGHSGDMVYVLRDQIVTDHDELRAEIETLAVFSSVATENPARYTSAALLRECVLASDPGHPPADADAYAVFACQIGREYDRYDEDCAVWTQCAPLYPTLIRARAWCLFRQSKKPDTRPRGWVKSVVAGPAFKLHRSALEESLLEDGCAVPAASGLSASISPALTLPFRSGDGKGGRWFGDTLLSAKTFRGVRRP